MNIVAQEDRTRFANVPFPDYEVVGKSDQPLSTTVAITAKEHTSASQGSRKSKPGHAVSPALPSLPDNEDDEDMEPCAPDHDGVDDNNDSPSAPDDDASDEDSNVDEEDFAELMSTTLPPARRVVQKRVSEGSYTMYKIQTGSWVTYYELKRLANIARNDGIIAALGIAEAAGRLTARESSGQKKQAPISVDGDDDEYSTVRTRPSVPLRAQPPRASKGPTLSTW